MFTNVLEAGHGYLDRSPLRDPRHRGAIESLAQELGLPLDTIAVRYEEVSNIYSPPDIISNKTMKSLKLLSELFRTLVSLSEFFGLAVIAVATTYAMGREAWGMVVIGKVTLTDLLLMFLYLEILVMVTQYFKAGQLPVKFPLYIAIISLARELILNIEKVNELHMLASAAAILLIASGVLVIRYGQFKFPEKESSLKAQDEIAP